MKKIIVVLITFAFFNQLIAQDTIFIDNFDNNRNQWSQVNTKSNLRKIENGVYYFQNKLSKGAFESRIAVYIPDSSDYEIGMIFRKIQGPNDRANGLIWASNGKERFSFVISGNGKFAIDKLENGKWTDFYPWTALQYIKKDTAFNKLTLKKAGEYFVFYINDKRMAQIKYQKPFGNQIGFYVSRKTTIEVSKIWVVKNKSGVFIPVKTYAITNDSTKKADITFNDKQTFNKKEIEKNIEVYNQYLKIHPESEEARFYRAEAYSFLGKNDKAISDYTTIIEKNPNNVDALISRAHFFKKSKQYNKAIFDLQRANSLDTNCIKCKVELSELYLDMNNYNRAMEIANELILKYPQSEEAYNLRGEVYAMQNLNSEAIRDYNKALAIRPDYKKASINLQRLRQKLNNENPEIEAFTELIKNSPLKADNYYYRGLEREKVFDFKNALDDYTKAINLHYSNDEIYLKRANLYEKYNEKEKALADYNTYLQNHQWDINVITKRINLLEELGQLKFAEGDLNKVIKMQPQNVEFYRKRSTLLIEKKEYDKALFDLQTIVRLDSTDNKADFEYGKILFEHMNNAKEGCMRIEKAKNKGNKEAEKYFAEKCKLK